MKRAILLFALIVLTAQDVWANHTAIIGGFRDGLAFGLQTEQKLTDRWEANFAMETTTGEDMTFIGDNPFTMFGGLKYRLGTLGQSPAFLCFGAVGNYGVNTEYGGYASLTLEDLYQNPALYLDLGADIFSGHTHAFVQLGYRLLAEPSGL
ncbi:MAG: hypothetical protein MUC35_05800 [Candidatus Margulisbacteria bacterium]|jgi:hypothetical protein|nr:hypothetical protein [Candidatus Margulisiibacteriota bacterium]